MGPTELRNDVPTGTTNTVDARSRNHLSKSSLKKFLTTSSFCEEKVPGLAKTSLKDILASADDNITPIIDIRVLVTDFFRCTYCVVTHY